jgi:uncharacterized protein with GYD domain
LSPDRWTRVYQSATEGVSEVPKYLFQGSYTAEGVQGLLKEGGTRRRDVARQVFESVGGKLEAYYFAFGTNDVIGIADVPDNASMAAVSLAISARGAFRFTTTPLLTPEEIDEATMKRVVYRAPGQEA